jgi:Ca-activated chloride channel family protein
MRTTLPFALLMLAARLAAEQAPAAPPHGTFRTESRSVAVYVTVADATGKLVPDLTQDDFEVYDNGKKQDITLFDNGVQPITVVMMLDRSGSMIQNFRLVRNAAEQFVGLLMPGDQARIGSFANRIQVDPRGFTDSQRDLIEILRTQLQEPGPTPLWNAVNVGITSLLHQDGRRVVLVFTDGIDHPGGSNNISFRDAAKNAEEQDVMVFAIGLAGREGSPMGRRGGVSNTPGGGFGTFGLPRQDDDPAVDKGLPRIAAMTGGGYYELRSPSNLGPTFKRIADELHKQYALAFTPQKLDGKTHKIDVRIKRPDLVARARKTYVAPRDM